MSLPRPVAAATRARRALDRWVTSLAALGVAFVLAAIWLPWRWQCAATAIVLLFLAAAVQGQRAAIIDRVLDAEVPRPTALRPVDKGDPPTGPSGVSPGPDGRR